MPRNEPHRSRLMRFTLFSISYICFKLFQITGQGLKPCPAVFFAQTMHPFPLCRAEQWRFYREKPEGGRQGCHTFPGGQGSPFWQTPIKTTERRKQVASGGFLLDTLSLADCAPAFSAFTTSMLIIRAKKSISSVGARTHIQTTVAVATHLCFTSLCSGFRRAAQVVPTCLPHLTHMDVWNACNRMERLQPRHP